MLKWKQKKIVGLAVCIEVWWEMENTIYMLHIRRQHQSKWSRWRWWGMLTLWYLIVLVLVEATYVKGWHLQRKFSGKWIVRWIYGKILFRKVNRLCGCIARKKRTFSITYSAEFDFREGEHFPFTMLAPLDKGWNKHEEN